MLNATLPGDTMTLSLCFKVRSLILAAALIAVISLSTDAAAQERSFLVDLNNNIVTPLGTLGGPFSIPQGINDTGEVAGWSPTTAEVFYNIHPFITGPD